MAGDRTSAVALGVAALGPLLVIVEGLDDDADGDIHPFLVLLTVVVRPARTTQEPSGRAQP